MFPYEPNEIRPRERAFSHSGRAKSGANSTFLLSPHFPRGSNTKKLFRAVRFHAARTGTLATQAITSVALFALVLHFLHQCYTFCTSVTLFALVLHFLHCTALSQCHLLFMNLTDHILYSSEYFSSLCTILDRLSNLFSMLLLLQG